MTPRGVGILAGAILGVAVGRLLGVAELYVAGAAAGVLVVAALIAARSASANVVARRSLSSKRLLVGGSASVALELRNASRLPATLLLVEDRRHPSLGTAPRYVVPGLRPGQTQTLPYLLTGTVRGRYAVGPVTIRVRDPFGLAERLRRDTATDDVLVYPPIEALPRAAGSGMDRGAGSSNRRRLYAEGDEFYTMREYVQGDDLRQVHWPSTAHRQKLMVRQQELAWQTQATLLCDTRAVAHRGMGPDSTLERAIGATASVLWHLADQGYSLRLATDESAQAPPVEPWGRLLDRLAELRPGRASMLAPALERLRGSGEGLLVAVLAPPPGEEDLGASAEVRALLRAGRAYTGRIALVVVDRGRRLTFARGLALARVLSVSGWRAAPLGVDEPLADVWRALAARRSAASARRAAASSGRGGAG
ncbi:MAG: DUF58 domain-containing protein [Nitriliruptorales bacterium]|nr:DUF58 domain-containing protein [Nitriliruptorales bacterium]